MKNYNKLIRDRIPEVMEKEGVKFRVRILNDEEYKEELLKKLVEEAKEVLETKGDRIELVREIGDILEVIESIQKIFELNKDEIEKVKNEKKNKRGGFKEKLFLESVDA